MLLILPHEIIIQIARKLDFKDKLSLVMTCQKLANLIKNRCLYEKLLLIRNQEDSEIIVEKFKTNQLDGRQVKELFYQMVLLSDDFFVQFPSIFPNVTRAVDVDYSSLKQRRKGTPIAQLEKWVDTLEFYKVEDDWYKMASLMQTMTFACVTHLYLTCSNGRLWEGMSASDDIRRTIRFEDCIEHVPALKLLHLHEAVITLSLLEKIYRSCAQLHTFQIKDSLFLMDDEILPLSIIPAKNITRFEIEGLVSFCDRKCLFIDYIVQKYTNLRDCIFYPIMVEETDVLVKCYPDDFDSYEDKIGNSRINALTEKIKQTHELYRKETANFLSRLPETVKGRFEFNADMFDDVPESLELTKVRPVDLIIQQRNHNPAVFTKSDHLGYLRGLATVKHLELHIDPSLHLYEDEIASNSATSLLMFVSKEGQYNDINFGRILSAFPLLEELTIYSDKNAFFIEDSIQQQQRIHLNLRKICISLPTVDSNFFTRLSKQAPNIKELNLKFSDEYDCDDKQRLQQDTMSTGLFSLENIDYTLDIRGFNLDQFEFLLVTNYERFAGVFTRNDVYFRVKIRDRTKRLVCCGGNYVVSEMEYHGVKETLPRVTILCDKVQQVSVCGKRGVYINQDQDGNITEKKIDPFSIYPIACSYDHFY